ncbi:macrophage mannose receptor 1-like [Betta splendens]|uniref:Macrophage mannose receptor 1-like n=1 Tax=Betta splendens TaxID=158456 RepID=A0A6P7NZK7_BETSP|nr:macrophage mannose receptor 1-like [Betta splendens]
MCLHLSSGFFSASAYFGREYYYMSMKMKWTEAQRYCRERFTDLATVENDYDNQRLLTLAQDGKANGSIWIGLRDDNTIWKWSMEGKDFEFATVAKFLTWQSGQPNNKYGNQFCVVLYTSQKINDLACGELHPFICYKDNSTRNYILVKQKLTWPEAQAYCREHYRDLVSIHSQDENNNILSNLTASGLANAWIGLYRDPWAFWSDKSTSTFRNWSPGKPDNMLYKEYCASFIALSGKWEDDKCEGSVPFFCFKGVTSLTVLKLKLKSVALLLSPDLQQLLLQQLQTRIASSGFTNSVLWRSVQRYHSRKVDVEC